MEKFMYNGRVLDTTQSTRVLDYILGETEVTLYKCHYGEWFYVSCENGRESAVPLAEEYVKQILLNRGRQDLIYMHFNNADNKKKSKFVELLSQLLCEADETILKLSLVDGGDIVLITWRDGSAKMVDIECDSRYAIINDVVRNCMY